MLQHKRNSQQNLIQMNFLVSDAGVLKRIDYSLIKGGGGKVLQVISAAVAKATFTSAIPDDDTTPTVSEGTEIFHKL